MEVESIKFSKKLLKMVFWETLRGASLSRTLKHFAINSQIISGEIIDLGSGTAVPSYEKYFSIKEPHNITRSDYYRGGPGVIKINLEEPFIAVRENFYDCVLCHSVLEHIYNYQNVVKESYKILKPGGTFIGSVPFIHQFHPCPNDYFRFTHQALNKLFSELGFKPVKIISLGFGPFSTATNQFLYMFPKIFRVLLITSSIIIDVLLQKIKKEIALQYPLGYYFQFKK